METTKTAILIPIYPPHFHFLNFLDSIDESKMSFDLYFILSNKDHEELLLSLHHKKIYRTICLSDYIPQEFISSITSWDKCIIHFKKYFGLLWLLKISEITYKTVGIVDAEVWFVNVENVPDKFNAFINRKKFIGSTVINTSFAPQLSDIIALINENIKQFFTTEEIEKISTFNYNFNFYFWFSDIPIYDMSIVPEFLKFICFDFDSYEGFRYKNQFIYEYIVYAYYCCLYHEYSLINIKDYGILRETSLEAAPPKTIKLVVQLCGYTPFWVIGNTYNEDKDFFEPFIIMTYHRNAPAWQLVGES